MMDYSKMTFEELRAAAQAAEDAGDEVAMEAIDAEMFSRSEMDAAIAAVSGEVA